MSVDKLNALQPVKQNADTLVNSVSNTGGGPSTSSPPLAIPKNKITSAETIQSMQSQSAWVAPNDVFCKNHLQIGLFFDGTGNNMDDDLPTFEHSNVVRMFRAHQPKDDTKGTDRIYIPGIGTPFADIGDNGKGKFSFVNLHGALGQMGQDRLDWAFKKLQQSISNSAAQYKEITMISLSIFGFSRGAALARAFLQQLIEKGKCKPNGRSLTWCNGGYPLEIRFVGIWDTVASVGIPMSGNNALNLRASRWGNFNRVAAREDRIIGVPAQTDLTARGLAFGTPGADPAPGLSNGHGAWGGEMAMVGEFIGRCVHMVSAHEQRNSFPLDSLLKGVVSPPNALEIVYPGVHSDVGGGYRPGEGGLGDGAPAGQDNSSQDALKLSQISLNAMYKEAIASGVALQPMGGVSWTKNNEDDFIVSAAMQKLFNHYLGKAGCDGVPLGDAMLRHMRLNFEWRFQHISSNGRSKDKKNIEVNEKIWNQDQHTLQAQKDALEAKRNELEKQRSVAIKSAMKGNAGYSGGFAAADGMGTTALPQDSDLRSPVCSIDAQLKDIEVQIDTVQGRMDSLPSQGTLASNLDEYDQALVDDARSIALAISHDKNLRQTLRPHYRNLVEAYENEFLLRNGMRDLQLITFFNNHVHDSLADFKNDSTLPSDPRVVYIGESNKLPYAKNDPKDKGSYFSPDNAENSQVG